MRRVAALVALCAGVALPAQVPDLGPPPGRLIDIGGRRLHLHCTGAGSPTVVLEHGASAFAIDWTLVQREVERTNRVCSYDRAGSGWSDRATRIAGASAARDLDALLRAAGEAPPYVLAGASLGGLLARLYQADYPTHVAGMVLVDPATEDRLFTMLDGQPVLIASLSAEQLRRTIPRRAVAVPRRRPQTGAPFDRLPRELYEQRIRLDERLIASVPDTVSHEIVLSSAEAERARLARLRELRARGERPLGALPLVVLTRDLQPNEGPWAVHAGLARLSTNSRHTVVAGAGHEIHLFAPEAVVQAISDVLASLRAGTPLPPR
jgi:pimeloyl-ACP methyl ester carboxylesterase